MEQEIACPGSNGNVILRAESIPFSQVSGQSKLFVKYQEDPVSLKRFYPSAVASHSEISERVPTVLSNFTTRFNSREIIKRWEFVSFHMPLRVMDHS